MGSLLWLSLLTTPYALSGSLTPSRYFSTRHRLSTPHLVGAPRMRPARYPLSQRHSRVDCGTELEGELSPKHPRRKNDRRNPRRGRGAGKTAPQRGATKVGRVQRAGEKGEGVKGDAREGDPKAGDEVTKKELPRLASLQFRVGCNESSVPNVKLTKARDGSTSTATFSFSYPDIIESFLGAPLDQVLTGGYVQGLFMVDEEGVITTYDLDSVFTKGKPTGVVARHVMRTEGEWQRFLRFMRRYAESNDLKFKPAGESGEERRRREGS